MAQNSFQLKGGVVTSIILELNENNLEAFTAFLQQKIHQAPQFFANSPILLDIQNLEDVHTDLSLYINQCRDLGLQPIGFKGDCSEAHKNSIAAMGLSLLNNNATRGGNALPDVTAPVAPAPEIRTVIEQRVETVIQEKLVQRPSKIVRSPVRSGQQVYAQGADLIILSSVNEGAEVIADGNVHIYGALRGRALAGVQGDRSAQIFCQSMEAELVSIAGDFMLHDSIDQALHKTAVRVELREETLQLTSL
ncbi:MAG: septum site-determining protein MinC [Pseudomonadales bacterium]|nr:septum site-determining protein MinC [Pseudomonadales bacterium]